MRQGTFQSELQTETAHPESSWETDNRLGLCLIFPEIREIRETWDLPDLRVGQGMQAHRVLQVLQGGQAHKGRREIRV